MKMQDKEQQASQTVAAIMETELVAFPSYAGSAYIDPDSKKDAIDAIMKFFQPMINELSDLRTHANKGVIVTMEQLNDFTETVKAKDKLKMVLADVTKERDGLVEVFATKEKRIERLLVKIKDLKAANGEITEARFDAIHACETARKERDELKALSTELLKTLNTISAAGKLAFHAGKESHFNFVRLATEASIAAITKATKQ